MDKTTDDQVIKYSKELKSPVFRSNFKEIARESASQRADYDRSAEAIIPS